MTVVLSLGALPMPVPAPVLAAVSVSAAVVSLGARLAPARRVRHIPGPTTARRGAGASRPRAGPNRRTGAGRPLAVGLAVLAGAVVAPPAVPIVLAMALLVPLAREKRRARRRDRALVADLPDMADLLGLALDAGLTVRAALALAAEHLDGPLASELRDVQREVAVGRRLADALDALRDRTGPAVRPLAVVLADSERSGAAAAGALHRLAADTRERRRRDAEEAARRLPVKLLFPLVGCVLPAFALLTVVPVVAGALRALRP